MAINFKNLDLKNIEFKNIYEWPSYAKAMVFFLVCAAVFYAGYYFHFSAQSAQIYDRYKQELDLKAQVNSILKTKQAMQEVVMQYPAIQKLLMQWQGQLIRSSNLPDLLNQILKLGAANHLQFSLFAPGEKKLQETYFLVPIKVVVKGGYNEVAHFISDIASLPQIVAVTDFVMSKQGSGTEVGGKPPEQDTSVGNLTTAMMLEVYFLDNKR